MAAEQRPGIFPTGIDPAFVDIGGYGRRPGGVPLPRTHRPSPPAFRAGAARLARGSDTSLPALAADLGVSSAAVRHWLRQADADAGRGQPGALATAERDGLRRLRREHRVPQ